MWRVVFHLGRFIAQKWATGHLLEGIARKMASDMNNNSGPTGHSSPGEGKTAGKMPKGPKETLTNKAPITIGKRK